VGAEAAASLFGQINSSLPRKKQRINPQVTASMAEKKTLAGLQPREERHRPTGDLSP